MDQLSTSEKWRNLAHLSFEDYLHKDHSGLLEAREPGKARGGSSSGRLFQHHRARCRLPAGKQLSLHALAGRIVPRRDVRFIYASSAATYGDGSQGYCDRDEITPRLRPLNQYGYSKQLFDLSALARECSRKSWA